MIIIGAGGFAKQLLEAITLLGLQQEILFFDNISTPPIDKLYDLFKVLHNENEVISHLAVDSGFALGIGNPSDRLKMSQQFIQYGGAMRSIVSPQTIISKYHVSIGAGTTILSGVIIEGNVSIGEGSLINVGSIITHDTIIGEYTEISPGVKVCGAVRIGSRCTIGTGAVLLPKVQVGNNVIIGAGSIITKNIPDNVVVAGVPGIIKRHLKHAQ